MAYQIAFYEFHPELLRRKLSSLVGGEWDRMEWVRVRHQSRRQVVRQIRRQGVHGPEDLPVQVNPYPDRLWLVVPRSQQEPLPEIGEYHWAGRNQLPSLDAFLSDLARRHSWAVIPWGGFMTDESLAFVTADAELMQQVIQDTSNAVEMPLWDLPARRLVSAKRNQLIARHDVQRSLADCAQIAVVEDELEPGSRLWEVAVPAGGSLYLSTGSLDWEFETGWTREIAMDEEPSPEDFWETTPQSLADSGELEVLGELLSQPPWSEGSRWLYRVNRPEVFTRLARRFQPVNGVPSQTLPGELSEATARLLLRRYLEEAYPSRFPVTDAILQEAPWFYTAGECHMDVTYQHFATRDRELLRRFIGSGEAEQLALITLF